MPATREQVCKSASAKLAAAAPTLSQSRTLVGLDGFVDEIIAIVDKRQDAVTYTTIPTIAAFGAKIAHAAGQSSNYELLVKQTKLGGNGPIMANALASVGMGVTYIGNLGYPALHPVFGEFADRADVISIAEPGHTDALEFDDGKLMLGKHQSLGDVNWDNLIERVGLEKLQRLTAGARLVGMVNWTMLPHLTDIWSKLLAEVIPTIPAGNRKFFVDLADPEKRTADDIRGALGILSDIQQQMDVILGLNLKESVEIIEVLGLPKPADAEAAIEDSARAIREKLGLGTVVIHPRRGAAAANAKSSAKFAGPFVAQPKISTGAGDHFNAGFCLGQVLGMNLEESLCTGVATSGYYVRTAISPSAAQLGQFIAELPAPQ